MVEVVLKSGHVQPVWAGHPWVFPQGIAETRGAPVHGGEVVVRDAHGNALGRGLFSSQSAIAVRLFTEDADETLDAALVTKRLHRAIELRKALGLPEGGSRATNGYRLLHGEGDGLPGLIVDRFDDVLVVQLGTAGMAQRFPLIRDVLASTLAPRAILDRTTERAASSERFSRQSGLVWGEPVSRLEATECGITLQLPILLGQKTGFYFDQRPLRVRLETLAAGRRVADTYSYVGAIGLAAARGGASQVVCVDSSAPALETASALAQANGLSLQTERSDAVRFLEGRPGEFDLVIADPPKLSPSRAARERALKAFRRIAAAAVGATAPGGFVVLSSCSAAIGAKEVERCLALGARDRGRRARVVERLFQGGDHPVPPAFPEALYLSTVIAYVE